MVNCSVYPYSSVLPCNYTKIHNCFICCADTTREKQAGEVDGELYYFTTQEQMLKDIANNQFIEYGQFDGNYYGTKFDTIRQCIRSGRMCILDISPQVVPTWHWTS